MTRPLLSRLAPSDAPALQRLYERCIDFAMLSAGEPAGPTAAHDEFTSVPPGVPLSRKRMEGILGDRGEWLGLMVSLEDYPQSDTWYIGLLLLDPAVRGRGIGSFVLREWEQAAAAAGAHSAELSVLTDNTAALQFWQRHGYETVATLPARRFGSKLHERHAMRKRLARP